MKFFNKESITLLIIVFIISFFMLLPQPDSKNSAVNDNKLSNNFIIRNVQFFDGDDFFQRKDLLIKSNLIHSIENQLPSQSTLPEIDATGLTLIPGLIDSHTHAYGSALEDAINFAVTTELDMFTMPEFAADKLTMRDKLTNVNSADLFSSTILATAPNGHGTEYGFDIPVLNSAEQAEQFVLDRKAQGADYIKAVYNSKEASNQYFPSISHSILESLIINSHQQDLILVVHVDNLISAKEAIQLGADGIVHSFMDQVVDEQFVSLMKSNNAFIIPTLSVEATMAQQSDGKRLLEKKILAKYINKEQKRQLENTFPDFEIPDLALQRAFDSIKILNSAGVTILAGTDAPNPGTAHGVSLHGEMELLVRAGLTAKQALQSATGNVRHHFPVGLRGTLKIGAPASMILIKQNPLDDIKNTQDIITIWKNGVPFNRIETPIISSSNNKIAAGLISNFNHSKGKTNQGLGIGPTSDKYAGGQSKVILIHRIHDNDNRRSNDIDNTPNKYLLARGEIKKGFIYPWGGIAYIPAKDNNSSVDLNNIKYLSFTAKGDKHTKSLSVLLFEKGSFQPYEKKIELQESWNDYRIALTEFKNVELSNISNISLVVTKKLGEFEFMIDDLKFE